MDKFYLLKQSIIEISLEDIHDKTGTVYRWLSARKT